MKQLSNIVHDLFLVPALKVAHFGSTHETVIRWDFLVDLSGCPYAEMRLFHRSS